LASPESVKGIRPFVDSVFGYDHPASCVVETDCLLDLRRNLDPGRIAIGRSMGDRQQDHKTWSRLAVAGGDETGRMVLSLITSCGRFMGPEIIVADDKARLRLRKGHLACSLQQFVERGMLRVHPGPFDGVGHHLARIDRSVAAPGGRRKPVIMLSRHQYEFPPAVTGNLDRLSPRSVLKLAELALEFQGAGLNQKVSW
jgi:hypothetical protein